MIRFKTILILLMTLFTQVSIQAQNVNTVADNKESITVDITVFGVKDKNACKEAIPVLEHTLFFRGFADSQFHKEALVGTDESFASHHPSYFKDLFDNGRFNSFISSSYLVYYDKKSKPKEAVVRFIVNTKALRLDLERQGVKRRFGL